eukprot:TRINITY_DN66975_c12_g1_i1.p1 TRINITY_DN66975_c12_g1~~TRINITY_DN66975_c12_g1_i1.p1  ORF type:complete len:171 (-),score=12.22 TRINITY_DN66975_c12_g1_i1:218-730(-)
MQTQQVEMNLREIFAQTQGPLNDQQLLQVKLLTDRLFESDTQRSSSLKLGSPASRSSSPPGLSSTGSTSSGLSPCSSSSPPHDEDEDECDLENDSFSRMMLQFRDDHVDPLNPDLVMRPNLPWDQIAPQTPSTTKRKEKRTFGSRTTNGNTVSEITKSWVESLASFSFFL